jgi:hypothetical protein
VDDWPDHTVPGLARVDLAVEQVTADCEQVRGITVGSDVVEYFIMSAVSDWILPGEDREMFRSQVVLCWNAKQDDLRRRMGET